MTIKRHVYAAVISVFLIVAANGSQAQTPSRNWTDYDMSRSLNMTQQFGFPVHQNGLFKNGHFDFRDRSIGRRDNSLLAQGLLSGNSVQRLAGGRLAQIGSSFQSSSAAVRSNVVFPMAPPPAPVTGTGTIGQITKWIGTNPNGVFILGDSVITELNGNIGIGTSTPISRLEAVNPAGTAVVGRSSTGIGISGISIDGLAGRFSGDVAISGHVGIGGAGVSGSTLEVEGQIHSTRGGFKFPDGTLQTTASVDALTTVAHNATLTGNGTGGSPLGAAVPLMLSGSGRSIITALNNATGGDGVVVSVGPEAFGVVASGGIGIKATGTNGAGVVAQGAIVNGGFIAPVGVAAYGGTTGSLSGDGIFAVPGEGFAGYAGNFQGDVNVTGSLVNAAASLKIDHPLDPTNKYLYHSFVESPEMMNIYSGNITTDLSGEAIVILPDYFEALNTEFRYQLTVIGTFARAIIASKINNNRFTIKTESPNVEVSWQVIGIRHDAFAKIHRTPVEEQKPERERGYYLHPEVFGHPPEEGVEWVRNPDLMQLLKLLKDYGTHRLYSKDR